MTPLTDEQFAAKVEIIWESLAQAHVSDAGVVIWDDFIADARWHRVELAKARAEAERLRGQMVRYWPVLERAESDPKLWSDLTTGLGIATLNGYRAALAPEAKEGTK